MSGEVSPHHGGLWVHAGDVVFTRGKGILPALIRWAERTDGEGETWANHVGVVARSGWLLPPAEWLDGGTRRPIPGELLLVNQAIVVESLWRTEMHRWFDAHRGEDGYSARVFRHRGLTEDEVAAVVRKAETFVGAKYGWWKLLFHLGDRLWFEGRPVLRSALSIDSRPICSYTVAVSFDEVGVRFGIEPRAADPDTMLDFCEAHPERWASVGTIVIGDGAVL